jgi:hypothetical protein
MAKKYLFTSIVITGLIFCYMAFPYYALYSLGNTLKTCDKYRLDKAIDFKSVRNSLKEQLSASIMEDLIKEDKLSENPFAALGLVLAPKLTDSIIDTYVTPSGLATLMKTRGGGRLRVDAHKIELTDDNDDFLDFGQVKYAFFSNPTTFLVEYGDIKLIFKLKDWWWKVSDILLPEDVELITPLDLRKYNSAAYADLRNATIAQDAYYIDNECYAESIDKLGPTYGLLISENVRLSILSANEKEYVMKAYNVKGDKTYFVKGPGGKVLEESEFWRGTIINAEQ